MTESNTGNNNYIRDNNDSSSIDTAGIRKFNEINIGESTNNPRQEIDLLTDPIKKREVKTIIENNIIDIVWNKYFYNFEKFDEPDNISSWGTSISNIAGVAWTSTAQPLFYVGADTDTSSTTSSVLVGKYVFQNDFLSYDKQQYFRTIVQFTSVTNIAGYVSIGGGYGFNFDGTSLTGFHGSNETATLHTLVVDTGVKLEAKLFPSRNKIFFYVDDIEKGSLVLDNTVIGTHASLWEFRVENNDTSSTATTKRMFVQWFELIQSTK